MGEAMKEVSSRLSEVTGIVPVGVDDGHWGIKVVFQDRDNKLVELLVPSRAASAEAMIGLTDDQDNCYVCESSGEAFIVSDKVDYIDTRFDGYPLSGLNRVLVNHALIKAGLGNQPVRIITGLPVDNYYVGLQKNEPLIQAKVRSLLDNPISNKNDSVGMPKIVAHLVQSEAIGAFYDILIGDDGSVREPVQDLIESGPIAILDIGGKTTDTAIVLAGGNGIDPARSGTSKVGALALNLSVNQRLLSEFKVSRLSPAQVDKAIQTGSISIFGKQNDCSDIIREEKRELAAKIIENANRKIGDGADLEKVFFVGGGAALLREELSSLYPHAVFCENPQFSNARGFFKIARYILE